MPMTPVSEEMLRAALAPLRVDPAAFEASVRTRISSVPQRPGAPALAQLSPVLRNVAALLPLGFLSGCQVAPATAKLTPAAIGSKLLSYLVFPALSLFALLGAAVFSVIKIQRLQPAGGNAVPEETQLADLFRQWSSDHRWGVFGVFLVAVSLGILGSSELLFGFYLASFGVLVYVLSALAKVGLGNRLWVGGLCIQGLGFLGQTSAFCMIGASEIHFLDQSLVTAVFFGGVLAQIAVLSFVTPPFATRSLPQRSFLKVAAVLEAVIIIPLVLSILRPDLWLNPPARVQSHVEAFDHARFSSASWSQWEIPAQWTIQSQLRPDLSRPRQLAASEIAGEQNPFVLSSAMRCGLLSAEQTRLLKAYDLNRQVLVAATADGKRFPILNLTQTDWVIRTAVLRRDLTPQEKDLLVQRLHATLFELPHESYVGMDDLLCATQLLELLGHPVQPEQYREAIHALLRELHTLGSGGFAIAGGFKGSRTLPANFPGDLVATAHAIRLMEIYGVPDGLDLLWVRSFLKPSYYRHLPSQWMIATVTLDRLNRLPGAEPPSWLDYLIYERTLLAAVVLVGLCLYATLRSPSRSMGVSPMEFSSPGQMPA